MMLRGAKVVLVLAVAVYYVLVVFNNIVDYGSNYDFVRHVLMMDSVFPGNHGTWRAIHSRSLYTVSYVAIIVWECVTMFLCGWGGARLARALTASSRDFERAKGVAIGALTLSLLMWLLAFLTVGGEWFLMWQSQGWNGQSAAFRMFAIIGIVLLIVALPEPADALDVR